MRFDMMLPGASTPTAWKVVFCEQRAPGGLAIWSEQFSCGRLPKLFNLRMDPYERGDVGPTNNFYQWMTENGYITFEAGRRAGNFLQTFVEYPPSQLAASFTIDQVEERIKRQVEAALQQQNK
jgi:hypothetical protein